MRNVVGGYIVAALLMLLSSACLEPNVVTCASGLLCPAGTVCDEDRQRCVSPAAIGACDELNEGDECTVSDVPGSCSGTGTCVPYTCGDGIQSLNEQCDGADLAMMTCTDFGYYGTDGLSCDAQCRFDLTGCAANGICGDGVLDEGEEFCDPGNDEVPPDLGPSNPTCLDFDFYNAAGLGCTGACTFDVSDCTETCGDDIVQPNSSEICDGGLLTGQSCVLLSADFGHLECTLSCALQEADCQTFDWQPESSGTGAVLTSVWGDRPNNVFAVGGGGVIRYFGGGGWAGMTSNTTQDLQAVWGSGDDDVFAVGNLGTIVHFDGTSWTQMTSNTVSQLNGVWGTGPNDVYAVGSTAALHYDGTTWTVIDQPSGIIGDISGLSNTEIYAVSSQRVERFDGSSWQDVSAVPTDESLWAIHAVDSNNIFVVGNNGRIVHYNGTDWNIMASNSTALLLSVWARSPTDVYAGGRVFNGARVILHYDGTSWTEMATTPDMLTYGLSSAGANAVIAVGDGGAIARFHGAERSGTTIATPASSNAIWGSSRDNVYAVGDGGSVVRFDGVRWQDAGASPGGFALESIWGWSATEMVVTTTTGNAESSVFWFDGVTFSPMATVFSEPFVVFHDVWGTHASNIYAAVQVPPGGGGGPPVGGMYYYNGIDWRRINVGGVQRLRAIWGHDADNIFAVGDLGQLVRYNGVGWSRPSSPTSENLRDVWGADASAVFAVGQNGAIVHWNGSNWSTMTSGTAVHLETVWGRSATDVYAAGAGGVILHYNGTSWSPVASPTAADINGLWGIGTDAVFGVSEGPNLFEDGTAWSASGSGADVAAVSLAADGSAVSVGPAGQIQIADLTDTWNPLVSPIAADLHAVVQFPGGVFVSVGSGGAAVHFDGSAWTTPSTPVTTDLRGAWGPSASDVVAVGTQGVALHFDGADWTALATGVTTTLNAVHGNASNNVYAVGDGGVILHSNGTSWTTMTSNTTANLRSVWVASDGDVVAVGDGGVALYYNGTTWQQQETLLTADLRSVFGLASNDVFAVGGAGILTHWNGTSWAEVRSGLEVDLNAVSVTQNYVLFAGAASSYGRIYRTHGWAGSAP